MASAEDSSEIEHPDYDFAVIGAAIPTIDSWIANFRSRAARARSPYSGVHEPAVDVTVSDRNPKGLPGRSAEVGLHCAFFAALRAAAHRFFSQRRSVLGLRD